MPEAIRATLIAVSLVLIAIGGYYRIVSQRSGDRLDRTKEGWPLLDGHIIECPNLQEWRIR
jgi:hypothetical protein